MAQAWSRGEFPLLSPYSWICGNLAGEFQYGVFSIFVNALIVLIWKFPLIFSQQAAALSIAHLAVLSAGAFMLARNRNLSAPSSMFVALIASLNGWIICWGASDWFGALGAFAWVPWAWWGAERALDARRSRWRFLWPAPFVYLVVAGGFPYTVLMLVLVLAWLAIRELCESHHLTRIVPLIIGGSLGLGLAAPAWWALLDYARGSARAVPDLAAHFQWLVPWNGWPGLVFPSWTVKWSDFSSRLVPHGATELACGLIPFPLILSAVIDHRFRVAFWQKVRWELALLILVAVFAMAPTTAVFRWSFRWLPLFHLVLALCAGEAMKLTVENADIAEGNKPSVLLLLIRPASLSLVVVVVLVLVATSLGLVGQHLFPLTWVFLGLAVFWVAVEYTSPRWIREWSPPVIIFTALLATYVCIPPNCSVPKYNLAQSLLQPEPLDPHRLYLSFYPPPEFAYRLEAQPRPVGQTVRLGSTSMWAKLRFVNGYSPIRPAGVAREFATSIHGEIDPNMGRWLVWNEADKGGLLARLGIDGIIVANAFDFAPRPAGEWKCVVANDEAHVYHRRGDPVPSVRSVDWDGGRVQAKMSRIVDLRNSVSASIAVPDGDKSALVAFSRPYFRGYKAWLDGRPLPVQNFRNLIPLVEVPASARGQLRLAYRPNWLIYGGAIAIISAVIWVASAFLALRSSRRA